MLLTLLGACLAMVAQDVLGTLLVIAESKFRPLLAGSLDAAGDVARLATMGISLDVILHRGLCAESVAVIAVVAATSFVATSTTTELARRRMQ